MNRSKIKSASLIANIGLGCKLANKENTLGVSRNEHIRTKMITFLVPKIIF
jgi:hypothetical protein